MSATSSIKGITLSGLQGDTYGGSTYKTAATVEAEIDAAKANFGANTIRLQIQQQLLVGNNGTQYDATYKATVDGVVQYALNAGLTVVINCQTENNNTRTCNYPNQVAGATNNFWQRMSAGWAGVANVIFDIFNEPDCNPGNPGGNWSLWQSSFNSLISYLRSTLAVTNTLWADADNWAASFQGCPGLTDSSGYPLVYSFHHPPSAASGDSAGWATDFGNWASTHEVVNGEFAQNSTFNWDDAYEIQQYLSYLAANGIGQTLWTVFGDGYFSDSSRLPTGWWGNMIANLWSSTGYTTYVFRSSVKWFQNYLKATGGQLSWTGGLYQGWSASENSMLVGAAGFNDLTARMALGTQWRLHVQFNTVHANGTSVTALLGVHKASTKPSTYSGLNAATNIAQLAGCVDGRSYSIDVPSSYLAGFASGTWKGVCWGPGPTQDTVYQGHHNTDPQLILEVHA